MLNVLALARAAPPADNRPAAGIVAMRSAAEINPDVACVLRRRGRTQGLAETIHRRVVGLMQRRGNAAQGRHLQ